MPAAGRRRECGRASEFVPIHWCLPIAIFGRPFSIFGRPFCIFWPTLLYSWPTLLYFLPTLLYFLADLVVFFGWPCCVFWPTLLYFWPTFCLVCSSYLNTCNSDVYVCLACTVGWSQKSGRGVSVVEAFANLCQAPQPLIYVFSCHLQSHHPIINNISIQLMHISQREAVIEPGFWYGILNVKYPWKFKRNINLINVVQTPLTGQSLATLMSYAASQRPCLFISANIAFLIKFI